VFIVCQLPPAVYPIYERIHYSKSYWTTVFEWFAFQTFRAMFSLLLLVNSVVNFFIYFLLGGRFRSILVNFMRCRHRDRLHNTRT